MKSRMPLHLERRARVVLVARRTSLISPAGKQLQQPVHRRLDQMDAGRFQRLDEARRQADRDDVADPGLAPPAGREPKRPRLGHRLAVEVGEQGRSRLVLADVARAIDVAVADPVLQRDAPLPAGLARDRARVRRDRLDAARTAPRSRGRTAASASSPRSRPPAPARSAGRGSPSSRRTNRPSTCVPFASVTDADVAARRMPLDGDDPALLADDACASRHSRAGSARRATRRNGTRRAPAAADCPAARSICAKRSPAMDDRVEQIMAERLREAERSRRAASNDGTADSPTARPTRPNAWT